MWDLKGVVSFFDIRTDVLEWKEIGDALKRVLGVDILGRGLEIPVDIDLCFRLLIELYLLLLHHTKIVIIHSFIALDKESILELLPIMLRS